MTEAHPPITSDVLTLLADNKTLRKRITAFVNAEMDGVRKSVFHDAEMQNRWNAAFKGLLDALKDAELMEGK